MKKKILVLTSTFPRWINDHEPPFVYELSRRFTDNYEVFVLAPYTAGSQKHENMGNLSVHRFRYAPQGLETLAYNGGISNNLKVKPLKYLLILPFLVSEYFAARSLVKKYQIDLIHAHWLIPQGLIAVLLKKLARKNIKTLITAHGSDVFSFNGRFTKKIKNYVLNNCQNLTVVSTAMKQAVIDTNTGPRIEILPMGTDLENLFKPGKKTHEEHTILFIGRLIRQKGVHLLLEAFSKTLIPHSSAKLIIIGNGSELEPLKEQARTLGITEMTSFVCAVQQKDVVQYLQQSSIAVFPYSSLEGGGVEGFGLVLIESLGCGCAVIASKQPAIQEIIVHEVTGILVEEGNIPSLAFAMSDLLENSEKRHNLATAGRASVLNKFDWQKIAGSYRKLIEQILTQ